MGFRQSLVFYFLIWALFNANKTKSQNSLTSITRTNFIISQSEPKHLTCRIIMNPIITLHEKVFIRFLL